MKVLEKLKGGLSLLADKIVKHEKYIYLIFVITIINFLVWFNISIKHTAELLKSETEKVGLVIQFEQLNNTATEQNDFINFQNDILTKQRKQLEESNQIRRMQEDILSKLIEYLKSINHWPPKIAPPNPTRSEA